MPSPDRRLGQGISNFRIPSVETQSVDLSIVFSDGISANEKDVIDYYDFNAHSVSELLCFFAGAVKEATAKRKLVGAFYGYLSGLGWHTNVLLESGHLGLPDVLNCQDIDILSSPAGYCNRGIGKVSTFPTAIQSVYQAGKVWIDENDVRTHSGHQAGWGWTDSCEETIEVQRRHLSAVFATGCGSWWMDQNQGWYSDPKVMTEISKLTRIGNDLSELDRSSVAEIAFVIDPDSMSSTTIGSDLAWSALEGVDIELPEIGAPVDKILFQDLDKAKDYKLYIFTNLFCLDTQKKSLIENKIKKDNKTCLWLYAPGLFYNLSEGAANISALTEINIRQALGHYTLKGRIVTDKIEGLPHGSIYGSDKRTAPFFWIDDIEAETLAISDDNSHPVLAIKKLDCWNSIYSVCTPVNSRLLRYCAEEASVHLWWKGEGSFYVNASFFAIHSQCEGMQLVNLPRKSNVFDLLENKIIATEVETIEVYMKKNTTKLFTYK